MDRFAFYHNMIKQNPHERPMYDKYMIYGGAEEYSFEEIRAINVTKRQKRLKQKQMEGRIHDPFLSTTIPLF